MYTGMRFIPLVAAAPAAGPLAPIVAGAGAVGTILSSLVGLFGGRKEPYDQWKREIEPTVMAQVQATGRPTYAAWYGEVIGINRSGQFVKLGTYTTLAEAEAILQNAANTAGELYALWNGTMRLFSPGATGVPPGGAGTAGSGISLPSLDLGTLALIGAVGAGVYVFARRRR